MNARSKPYIKFCGMTRHEDVKVALNLGVDYLGVILVSGTPRGISFDAAAQIRKLINSNVKMVTVVRNPTAIFLDELMLKVKPDIVQFHGDESPEFCEAFSKKFNVPFWKAIAVKSDKDVTRSRVLYKKAQALVFDAWSADGSGGHGIRFDWNLLSQANEDRQLVFLAGGLNPENLHEVQPLLNRRMIDGVDVSSGIEQEEPHQQKGVKSSSRMVEFFNKITEK